MAQSPYRPSGHRGEAESATEKLKLLIIYLSTTGDVRVGDSMPSARGPPEDELPNSLIPRIPRHGRYTCSLHFNTHRYYAGLLASLGAALQVEDPDDIDRGLKWYKMCQKQYGFMGTHHDVVDFSDQGKPPSGTVRPKDYLYVRYFKDILDLERTEDGYAIREGPMTETGYVWLPPGNAVSNSITDSFIVPSKGGARLDSFIDDLFGTPIETVKSLKEARKRWEDFGIEKTNVDEQISRFVRSEAGVGLRLVASASGAGWGPQGVSLCTPPDTWFAPDIYFPFSKHYEEGLG